MVHTTLQPIGGNASAVSKLKVYVRYDATIDNSGGGGTTNGGANDATVDPSSTALVSSDTTAPTGPFAAQVVGALVADHPFLAESSGFVGTPSDGLNQLDAHHALVDDYQSATDGNVVQTALLDTTPGRPFTLALGFAPTAAGAVASAQGSATQPFAQTLASYEAGWHDYDASLRRPPAGLHGFSRAQDAAMHEHLLAVGQRHQGRRGQDQHRRVRGLAHGSVGPVGAGVHDPRGLDVPRGVRARQL